MPELHLTTPDRRAELVRALRWRNTVNDAIEMSESELRALWHLPLEQFEERLERFDLVLGWLRKDRRELRRVCREIVSLLAAETPKQPRGPQGFAVYLARRS